MGISQEHNEKIKGLLCEIYSNEECQNIITQLESIIDKYPGQGSIRPSFSQEDLVLISYGDSIYDLQGQRNPLRVLQQFLQERLEGIISTVHLLPFYPYSSDDGFAVIDYKEVNPELGDWGDIQEIKNGFALICDFVANHISARSSWFQQYLQGNPAYQDYFIEVEKDTDLSAVTRARAHPLLTPFRKKMINKEQEIDKEIDQEKEVYLWTTFSADQLDLNYQNPQVLLEMVDTLLFYASQGASIIRLDAIGHIWKEIGSSCINLKEAHLIIQLFRAVLDGIYPGVALLTETNVPHKENISYFGNGQNEAQLVYQFALMGLVVYTFLSAKATRLMEWADSLEALPAGCTFFNILATHDGIGVMPVKGILSEEEIELLINGVQDRGGLISAKDTSQGKQPYELNITYYSAIAGKGDDQGLAVKKYLASQAILLSIIGIPAIYIHSLIGTKNYLQGVKTTDVKRTINRRKYEAEELSRILGKSSSREARIFKGYLRLLKFRKGEKAFHPGGSQQVIPLREELFSILRISPEGKERILVLINVANQEIELDLKGVGVELSDSARDIVSGQGYSTGDKITITPYQVVWLKL